jgi:glycosyltransferase involved in cell wall biosynthesis
MKILQITQYFLPHTGGLERYVWNLSKYLTENGHEVEIYTSNIPRTKKIEVIDGITIRRFSSIAEPLRNPIIPGLLLPTKNEIKKFDLIQVHVLYSFTALYGLLLKKFYNIPLILTHHGRMKFNEKYKDEIVRLYEKIVIKELVKNGDRCIVLTKKDAEFIASEGMNQELIKIIPNGIIPSELKNLTDIEINQFLHQYNLENKKIILFVGRMISSKGVDCLIKAFSRIKNYDSDSSLMLVLVGDGDQLKSLKQIVSDFNLSNSVKFLGELSFSDTIKFYQTSRIFVLPSLSEGFSTTILEALYFGLPVIASDIPVIRENFSDSLTLVPPNNEKALADAIFKLLKESEMTDCLSAIGKNTVITNYTWDKIIDEYEDLFAHLNFDNP